MERDRYDLSNTYKIVKKICCLLDKKDMHQCKFILRQVEFYLMDYAIINNKFIEQQIKEDKRMLNSSLLDGYKKYKGKEEV